MENVVLKEGFFAETFAVNKADKAKMKVKVLPTEIGEVSDTFQCAFENSGIMKDGIIYTIKTTPTYNGKQITLGDVMETGEVEEEYFIPEENYIIQIRQLHIVMKLNSVSKRRIDRHGSI